MVSRTSVQIKYITVKKGHSPVQITVVSGSIRVIPTCFHQTLYMFLTVLLTIYSNRLFKWVTLLYSKPLEGKGSVLFVFAILTQCSHPYPLVLFLLRDLGLPSATDRCYILYHLGKRMHFLKIDIFVARNMSSL